MAETTALFWRCTLLDNNSVDLSVVRNERDQRANRLRASRTTLQSIKHILEAIIDVVPVKRTAVEVEPHLYF